MDKIQYKIKYNEYLNLFSEYSEKVFSDVKTNNKLADAMKYSFFAGGKRIRPVIMLAFADIIGLGCEKILPFALALECIHTYSLIHDDLPALDNDVLRRGNPTCHIKFDEATAILAGDALLNFAFEHVLDNIKTEPEIKALKILSEYSGYRGMLSGQQSDIESEKVDGTEKVLIEIHKNKTCKLLTAPFIIPTVIKGDAIEKAERFGYLTGLIFQFADDYLDLVGNKNDAGKSMGKDIAADKFTAIKFYGVDGLKIRVSNYLTEAENIANILDKSLFLQCFLHDISDWIYEN